MEFFRPPNLNSKSKRSITVQGNNSKSQSLTRHQHRPSQRYPKQASFRFRPIKEEIKNDQSREAKQQSDLSSSDLYPLGIRAKRSIRLVETWLEACEKAVYGRVEEDTGSMASLWGCGIVRRHPLDIPTYKPVGESGGQKLSWKRSKPGSSTPRKVFKPPKVRDCVYEKSKWALRWELLEGKRRCGRRKESAFRRLRNFFKGLPREHSQIWQEQEEQKFFMSGGRSLGIGASLETLLTWGDFELSNQSSNTESNINRCRLCEDGGGQSSSPESDAEQGPSGSKSKPSSKSRGPIEPSKTTSTANQQTDSHDIIPQYALHTKEIPKLTSPCSQLTSTSTTTMSSPGSNYSRASSFNIGSIIELSMSSKQLEEREKRERLETTKDRTPSPDPFRPSTPRPIQAERVRSWASIPLRRKPSTANLKPNATEVAGNEFTSLPKSPMAAQPNAIISVRKPGLYFKEQIAMPGVIGQGTQAFLDKREKRADRNAGIIGAVGGNRDQQADIDKEMEVFRSNRERRRAERRSAGQIMEAGTVGGMTSGGAAGQKKRVASEGKKPFNIDDEPVACGYEWERLMEKEQALGKGFKIDEELAASRLTSEKRIDEEQSLAKGFKIDEEPAASDLTLERRLKKDQSSAKKSPAERYREDERAKYWNPK